MAQQGWQTVLSRGGTLVLDGGTGSELRRRGMPLDPLVWSALAPLTHYDLLRAIHADYIAAGADVVTTSTFATTRFVLEAAGTATTSRPSTRAPSAPRAKRATRAAARSRSRASISCLPPGLRRAAPIPTRARESAAYLELAETLAEAGVDLLLLEMMQETRHAPLACEAAAASAYPSGSA